MNANRYFSFGAPSLKVRSSIMRILLLALCLSASWSWAERQEQPRVVAVGDVHGHYEGLIAILQETKLIDEDKRWIGDDAVFVQLGDLFDRGADVKRVMDLLMRLQSEAAHFGGRVEVLLGNHEAMNMLGVFQDLNPDSVTAFKNDLSKRRVDDAYEDFEAYIKRHYTHLGLPIPDLDRDFRKAWKAAHPPGFFEFMDAIAPNGHYGKWLRERPASLQVGNLLFVHGGISDEMAKTPLVELNRTVGDHLKRFDDYRTFMINKGLILPSSDARSMVRAAKEYLDAKQLPPNEPELDRKQRKAFFETLSAFLEFRGGWLLDPHGPLWYRGYAKLDERSGERMVRKVLEAYDSVDHIIVGHSPRANGMIEPRFDGAVFLIDTGMLTPVYNGQAAALEIHNGTFTAFYVGQREVLLKTAVIFKQEVEATQPPQPKQPPRSEVKNQGTGTVVEEEPRDGVSQMLPMPYQLAFWSHVAVIAAFDDDEDDDDALDFEKPPFLPIYAKDGSKYPFSSYKEVLEFMREAEVIEQKEVGDGITKPLRLVLEKDGMRMRAIFRHVDEKKDRMIVNGTTYVQFRDSFKHEVAAFRLALLLGINRVPVAMPYTHNGDLGSLQVWVENARTERARVEGEIDFPESMGWNKQRHLMLAFDALVYNIDRHGGNMLYDKDWTLWFIDHTRAFQVNKEPFQGNSVYFVEANFFKRLKEVEDEEIEEVLEPLLGKHHVKAVLKRRKKLVSHIEKMIAERGENIVLFKLEP